MKQYINPSSKEWTHLLERPNASSSDLEVVVAEVFEQVKAKGDKAIKEYTQEFDKVSVQHISVTKIEIQLAENNVADKLKEAIQRAKQNIEVFHSAQKTPVIRIETEPGVNCWQEKKAIEKVGLYIPGGSAPLFSTILMLAVPAKIAGCNEIILCTPPDKTGNIPAVVLYTANLCGITSIFRVGGIQAIAGMTFGTESIPGVYKIFGPGNQYVTAAKQWATRFNVSIDMPAGPSELLVVADDSADPDFIAADLLSQAEHGPDSQVILLSDSESLITEVDSELNKQVALLSRKDIAVQALEQSHLILVNDMKQAVAVSNMYGPEHLIVQTANPHDLLPTLRNAGSIFVGAYTPESAGDYASGTNHVLPTYGYSKVISSLSLADFSRRYTVQELTREGLASLSECIIELTDAEGLDGHQRAVTIRLED